MEICVAHPEIVCEEKRQHMLPKAGNSNSVLMLFSFKAVAQKLKKINKQINKIF